MYKCLFVEVDVHLLSFDLLKTPFIYISSMINFMSLCFELLTFSLSSKPLRIFCLPIPHISTHVRKVSRGLPSQLLKHSYLNGGNEIEKFKIFRKMMGTSVTNNNQKVKSLEFQSLVKFPLMILHQEIFHFECLERGQRPV